MSITIIPTGATFTVPLPDEVYLLPVGELLTVAGFGIDVGTMSGVTLLLEGNIDVTADVVTDIGANDLTIIVGTDATLRGASDGIEIEGADFSLFNNGVIIGATNPGVQAQGIRASIQNFGTILAEVTTQTGGFAAAVFLEATDGMLFNAGLVTAANGPAVFSTTHGSSIINSGTLSSNADTVAYSGLGLSTLVNSGLIESLGGPNAIVGSVGRNVVVNTGIIDGNVTLGDGNDIFDNRGGSINGIVATAAGSDVIFGGTGKETLKAGGGSDSVHAGVGDDVVDGGGGNDDLSGEGGNDDLRGGAGNDRLAGNVGADLLRAQEGKDILDGGPGDDLLFGGSGGDTFVFRLNAGDDRIADYEDGRDLIDLTAYNLANFAQVRTAITNVFDTAEAIIDLTMLGGNGSITIDAAADLLNGADFIL